MYVSSHESIKPVCEKEGFVTFVEPELIFSSENLGKFLMINRYLIGS